jgi:uncharacterized membrane-anchored protein YitT (DUF2179 family)
MCEDFSKFQSPYERRKKNMPNRPIFPTPIMGENATNPIHMSPKETALTLMMVTMTTVLVKFVSLVIIAMGTVGNIIAFLVNIRQRNRTISTCFYMASLSLVDTTVLWSFLPQVLFVTYKIGEGQIDKIAFYK